VTLHPRVHIYSPTPTRPHKKGDPLRLDRKVHKSVGQTHHTSNHRAGPLAPEPSKTVRTRSRCLSIRTRQHPLSKRQQQQKMSSGLPFKGTKCGGKKLLYRRPRVPSHHQRSQTCPTSGDGIASQIDNLHGPRQPLLLLTSAKTE
jgi:hypothetical protein